MTLSAAEFMRRFLLHVLPSGFHRIRHYGLLANDGRKSNLAHVRELLQVPAQVQAAKDFKTEAAQATVVCPHCGAGMVGTATLPRRYSIRAPPASRGAR